MNAFFMGLIAGFVGGIVVMWILVKRGIVKITPKV